MRCLLPLLLPAAQAASGGARLSPLANGQSTVVVSGRRVVVHNPGGQPGALPLVVALHGWGGSAAGNDSICKTGGISALSERVGFVGICPEGTGDGSWNAAGCCGTAAQQDVDDVSFLKSVVSYVKQRANVGKVYAVGLSNGAMMAWRIACEAHDVFDGVAPVAGGWYGTPAFAVASSQSVPSGWRTTSFSCSAAGAAAANASAGGVPCSSCWNGGGADQERQTECWSAQQYACTAPAAGFPILYTHGTADTNEPYALDAANFRHYAAGVLGCSGEADGVYRQGKATCSEYSRCAAGRRVAFCSVAGMRHQMPGTQQGFDAVATALSWFGGGWPAAAE